MITRRIILPLESDLVGLIVWHDATIVSSRDFIWLGRSYTPFFLVKCECVYNIVSNDINMVRKHTFKCTVSYRKIKETKKANVIRPITRI